MRRKVIAGNWKMNLLPNETIAYMEKILPLVKDTNNDVIVCIPYIDLFYGLLSAQNSNIMVGAQNMHFAESGAYTGEVSGDMLESINTQYVIIGHSERRQYFAETDESVNKKVKSALKHHIKPIICVGETLEERESGKDIEVITNQTARALEDIKPKDMKNIILAYEPIWAIGTGKTPTTEDANNSIKAIRKKVREILGDNVADEVIILYGGSVTEANAKELFETSDIDGGLVGGASLKPEVFAKIVNYDK